MGTLYFAGTIVLKIGAFAVYSTTEGRSITDIVSARRAGEDGKEYEVPWGQDLEVFGMLVLSPSVQLLAVGNTPAPQTIRVPRVGG